MTISAPTSGGPWRHFATTGWRGWSLVGALVVLMSVSAEAQLAPEIGYAHPAGGRPGATVEVVLGGYDWTPDMQLFVHDPRIGLELLGPPSPVLVPDPPYWFGAKGRGPAWPLPREFRARLTIPADAPPGLVRWQVANANGASPVGWLHIGSAPEVVEDAERTAPQVLPALPVTVSGQIRRIEEVDRYEFQVAQSQPVTIELTSRRIGSPLHGMLQVRDSQGRVLVDLADTEGRDLATTFPAAAGERYVLSLHDLDYAGDRSYVYRLELFAGPRILAALPAAGRRGETRPVEFLGGGLATGGSQLESVTREVTFPAAADASTFAYALPTPWGPTRPFAFLLTDVAEVVQPAGAAEMTLPAGPVAVTAALETRYGTDQFAIAFRKDEKWRIAARSLSWEAPLDLDLTVLGPDGGVVGTADDAPGSLDPVLTLTAPADGTYRLVLADRSGKSGSRAAAFRLSVESVREDFTATVPAFLSLPLGGQGKLPIKIVRDGDFKSPLALTLTGLPEGVTAPAELSIPGDKNELTVELTSAADGPSTAALCKLAATTTLNGQPTTRELGTVLVAAVMKPRCKITPEGLDDVRKVHRGSTYLAPLFVDRLEGFQGAVVLEMTSKQQRHRQGLASDELVVPPDVRRVEYPIFVPEWMETTKTSRMILNGAVQVADPRGRVRTLLQRQELRLGILPEGALLKLAYAGAELTGRVGGTVRVPLSLSRSPGFAEPVRIEFVPDARQQGLITADSAAPVGQDADLALTVRIANEARAAGEHVLRFRASALQGGKWPVVSEERVPLTIQP